MSEEPIKIILTNNEALVLDDFLSRFNKKDSDDPVFEDQAEQRVLWNMECELERQLTETFNVNYPLILKKARNEVRDEEYSEPEYSVQSD